MIGRTIGHYRIVEQLGRGGSGTVYRAVDATLDREVAIKVLNPELVDTDAMRRFQSEATILAKLNHPSIATIYELFHSEADLLMVMELVRGKTLERTSDELGPLPPDRAAPIIERILSALAHAHHAGVVVGVRDAGPEPRWALPAPARELRPGRGHLPGCRPVQSGHPHDLRAVGHGQHAGA